MNDDAMVVDPETTKLKLVVQTGTGTARLMGCPAIRSLTNYLVLRVFFAQVLVLLTLG